MELINLTTKKIFSTRNATRIVDANIKLQLSVVDMMYKVMDGECQPEAVRNYLESVLPRQDHRNIILPYIKNDDFMRTLAQSFGKNHYNVWTTVEDDIRVIH